MAESILLNDKSIDSNRLEMLSNFQCSSSQILRGGIIKITDIYTKFIPELSNYIKKNYIVPARSSEYLDTLSNISKLLISLETEPKKWHHSSLTSGKIFSLVTPNSFQKLIANRVLLNCALLVESLLTIKV